MNILQVLVENESEQVGEMAAQVYVPAQADEDRLTYITLDTEVHSGVFVDEQLGDTVQEVTSPIFGEKQRVRKRAATLQMLYTVEEKLKCRKQEGSLWSHTGLGWGKGTRFEELDGLHGEP